MMEESGSRCAEQKLQLMNEMKLGNFDSIRFASYRTASKLRFVQKKLNLHLIDIWNVIESFRENGLNVMEHGAELNVSRLEALVSSLYINLNKRLPAPQQISVETYTSWLLNWLLSSYSVETLGKIRVLSVKVALAVMCSGKLMDKLRYLFSQLCDANGFMVAGKFANLLKQILTLPSAVYESPSFPYKEQLASEIFGGNGRVTVNDFIDTLMSDPGPSCLVWLPLLHRIATIEQVVHCTSCDVCGVSNFTGFRYKCTKCHNFQMCQDCFWHGNLPQGSSHALDHEVREYTTFKSPSKQIGQSLRKSFRCVPDKGKSSLPRFPDTPEKPLNLSHIVPPSPLPSHNGFPDYIPSSYDMGSLDSRCTSRSPGRGILSIRVDDEHKLIARYAARLAQEAQSGRTPTDAMNFDTSRAQRELISQLEAKNREIMQEIARLRREQEVGTENPVLMTELRLLRQRKNELEAHLTSLQDSRRHLMLQLEGLMKLLKNHQASPRSTPNTSPRASKSPPPGSRSAPPTPTPNPCDAMTLSAEGRLQFGGSASLIGSPSIGRLGDQTVCSDLLEAADSVTHAMSSLVRELNSESPSLGEPRLRRPTDFEQNRYKSWQDKNIDENPYANQQFIQKESEMHLSEESWNIR